MMRFRWWLATTIHLMRTQYAFIEDDDLRLWSDLAGFSKPARA